MYAMEMRRLLENLGAVNEEEEAARGEESRGSCQWH